ncbi:acyl-CoA dehydrogenase [Spirosoma montaniterrae]|uniref:Acyl-CoA dehydrogenase n=1 Tax=Spirosoma montaniterrae TaxID=1178516 RepID=A0A1P9X176_9BACT|nr:acyl-CoA dehydrogenase [Spirosoma montaniterrae]AQG81374.1 acyl-CoA dehydrogenase [Spirosoma montaniterrae]
MATQFYSPRDLRFQLYEVLNAERLTKFDYFRDHDRESFDMVLDAARQISETVLKPLLTVMDRNEPQLVAGKIRVHPQMRSIIKKFGDDGWINAPFRYDEGGQQLPATIMNAATFIFGAANYSSSVFPFLTTGAANLLRSFGSAELIDRFTPKMYAGQWQGTMALTEPDAGSSLSDITTTAEPTDTPGTYQIRGQKIYISAGDHDAVENVVHLMLAKIKGGPAGAKGISLFAVPQQREENGQLVDNDVLTAGVYHKMGYKGAPIAHLMVGSNGGTIGYLVGEPHQGLRYMFQMMNEARVGVGMNAVSIGTAAYYASLEYARERPQGRPVSEKDPTRPQVPIIRHADVKRMLLFQKSVLEGSLSLLLYCSYLADLSHVADGDEKANAALLLDLLTPVAKSYPSEMGCLTTSAAVQVLGGAGYTTDFPVEQFYREARIHPIHEGTTGIHGLDLLGRKVTLQGGKGVQLLLAEIERTLVDARPYADLQPLADQLTAALGKLDAVTKHLLSLAPSDTEAFLADATLYLELFGIITIAWQWLRQATVAQKNLPAAAGDDVNFYQGKLMTARYFYEYELVKVYSLARRLQATDRVTLAMKGEWF